MIKIIKKFIDDWRKDSYELYKKQLKHEMSFIKKPKENSVLLKITREDAIKRILLINKLSSELNYIKIEEITYEDLKENISSFVSDQAAKNIQSVELNIKHYENYIRKYANSMLQEMLNKPFFRYTRYEKYNIIEE